MNSGIYVYDSSDNTIGGAAAGEGNLISKNNGNGIELGFSSNDNLVEGNDIGTDETGTVALGNLNNGIEVDSGNSSNTIGGTSSGAGNLVSGNTAAGIVLNGASSCADPREPDRHRRHGIESPRQRR